MTPERWRQVTELFHAARALDVSERPAYLRQADGDEEVLAEVRAMLAAYEKGAPDVPAVAPSPDPIDVEPGSAIGPYEVREMIGAGGMGRVYRARDSRLDRDVALKVLPSHYAADADRLRRFEQEARASGALTHPNLVTVFDVGTDNGRPYLVTELLDGETLRDRLRRGALPLARAADIGAALARGVAAAHARGIVHRDLKPENVMITRDGRVKILDFGVAKLRSDADVRSRGSLRPVQTESGVVIGTAGYMAPEQIRGADADGRADVFALGAILFELLTGQRAFDGPTRADTFESTLRADPLSSPATATWPPAVLRIVQRCLEKDPETRFQSAADLAFALETITDGSSIQRVDRTHARRLAPVAIGATLLLAVAGGVVQLWQPAVPTGNDDQLVRFAIPIGPRIRYTERPAISRDGTTIVYPASEGLIESRQLYVRRIDQITTVALSGTTGASSTFFSPGGESVAFWSEGALNGRASMARPRP